MSRIYLLVGILAVSPAWSDDCVKASVSGKSCETLAVELDFSACAGAKRENLKAKVSCHGTAATATAKTSTASYTVALTAESAWGGELNWSAQAVKEQAVRKVAGNRTQVAAVWTAKKSTQSTHATSEHHESTPAPAAIAPVTPVPAEAPAASALSAAGITFSAIFDGYYSYNFNNPNPITVPTANTLPTGNTQIRYYDAYANQFSLALAEFTIKKTKGEVGFLLDLDFGLMADMNSLDEVGKHVGQAILTYSPAWAPGLVIDFGKMATHVGYELIKSKDNWQYSRSTTFGYGSPFWNTGLHIGYAVSPSLTLSGYLYNNSVNNGLYATSTQKTLGAQVKYAPSSNFAMIYNFISGGDMSGAQNKKTIHEANITYTHNDQLAFALELLAGQDSPPAGATFWKGITAHMKYKPSAFYSFSPRFEVFDDSNGASTFTNVAHTLYGVTLTNSFYLTPELETRLEFRADQSSKAVFTRGDGGTTNLQATATIGVLYNFSTP